ncbi:hypothetical protein DOM22_16735 [Bdellovibrio sp. ZAP7]|uniref:TIGR02147 family protein n=1 Tax=Bdellovibrio sp. ZAP7 TaxID=2231053 RepID=UPI00115A4A33|nr:TIGR02147 family protein [Bdellovibrio sp. ZAP7]QDK46681.1 hypothetical protein DOM22_16735 [Bdellovibrio sp. ZAP7]
MKTIFDYKSYKTFLVEICSSERGLLTRLAEAGECQKSYLSACLNGKNHLTLDQVFGMSEYLGMTDTEQEYLFLLVEKEKANTPKLRKKLEDKIRDLSREAYRLKNQQREGHVISDVDSGVGTYYSNWMLTAIHTLSSITKFQTAEQIGKRLGLSVAVVQHFLNQLEGLEFVTKEGGRYKWGSGNIHLSDDSSWVSNHHLNWRLRSIENTQKNDRMAIHYTAIQSISENDFELLKKKIANFIKEFNKVSDPSDPEEAFCFSLDFFKV